MVGCGRCIVGSFPEGPTKNEGKSEIVVAMGNRWCFALQCRLGERNSLDGRHLLNLIYFSLI